MQTRTKKVIAVAAIMSFVAIGSHGNSQLAGANGPPGGLDVRIVNPLPVPITGSVISQDASKLASNLVRLNSDIVGPGTERTASKVTPDGVFTAFVVPNDRSLVVTSIDIEPVSPGAGTNSVFLTSGPDTAAVGRWSVPNSSVSQFAFQSGIVFPAGSVVKVRSIPASTGQVVVTLGGYLTAS
jgi:hypothetical protein